MSGVYPAGDTNGEIVCAAHISDDQTYRYWLRRTWDTRLRTATFIMLNPSTADAVVDDPTIRRCVGFAAALGCGSLVVVNVYAYRATKPAELWTVPDPVGPDNHTTLTAAAEHAASHDEPLIAAWGTHARPEDVRRLLTIPGTARLAALSTTKNGAPGHPLYIPATARPEPWQPNGA